jgi:hypothetical protein
MGINIAPVSLAKTFDTRACWLLQPDVQGGILTVKVDFKCVGDLVPTAANLCQPTTFCQQKRDEHGDLFCGSALINSGANKDPLLIANPDLEKTVNAVCGSWAVKDLDCPKDGCFGFSFKLPDAFVADATIAGPTPHRPAPTRFPEATASGQPDWLTKFELTKTAPDNASGGACFYPTPLPGNSGCDVVEPTAPAPPRAQR